MQHVVRRRRTTVRITWVEQTLTETVEEAAPTRKAVAGPASGEPAEEPGQRRKHARRSKGTLPDGAAARTLTKDIP